MLRVADVLAPERDARAVAVLRVCLGAPEQLDGLCGAATEGRGPMMPRMVVTDDPSMPLVVTVYADSNRVDVPVTPLRALAMAGQLIEAAVGRLRGAQSMADKSDKGGTQ